MVRLRSARFAKAVDDATTEEPPSADVTVMTGTDEASVSKQVDAKGHSVEELALQTALKIKERIRSVTVSKAESSSPELQREPDILTLESKKIPGHAKVGRHPLSSSLDPGIKIKDNVYFEFGMTQADMRPEEEAIMKKSVITSDFEVKEKVPAVFTSRYALERMKKAERGKSTGKQWFNMAAPELTPELKNDLRALQLRNTIDPKQHYKANDLKELPKYFQVGRVVAGPVDFYSARVPRRQQKRSLVEELFADDELRRYQKKKFAQLQHKHQSGTHRLKKIKHRKKFKETAA